MTLDTQKVTRYGVLPAEKRRELFGLDSPDLLEWRNWQPGTEYVKSLTLKNVSTNTIKVHYKQTASKTFSMDFPEPFKLRPGMSHALKVVFRPLRMQQYSDHIEIFINGTASYIILVEAHTPATHVAVPPTLDFGFVPCKELQRRPLVIRNTGDIKVGVSWKLEAPFSIEPQSASLAPGESHSFTVSFQPTEACSYQGYAACQLDNGQQAVCHVSGIAKFPYLSMEATAVDFGEVLVGTSVERVFRFANHSMVEANFSMTHDDEAGADGVFSVTPSKGRLGPEEYSEMRVVYTPKHTDTFSCETYTLGTLGGNKVTLSLRGLAMGPTVTFSARVLNFGNVTCGSSTTRALYLQNHSNIPVLYDFQIDPLDNFSISKPRGTIGPCTTGHVTVTFKAGAPANFWRRVACLIKDADPIGVDFLATSYNEAARPPPLEHRHVAAYMARVTAGGPPVESDPALQGSVPPSPVPSAGGRFSSSTSSTPLNALSKGTEQLGAMQSLPGPDGWGLLFGGQDPGCAISVDREVLEFGSCSRLSAAEYQAVVVTNRTAAKVTAFFVAPLWQDPAGGEPKPVFQVLPESADLKPGGSATFRVAFRPPRDAAHYCQTLALCAHIKSMRNFRLLTDSQVVPPWAIPITATGNTFLHTNPEFSPKVEISHRVISFPPVRPGEVVCQTLLLTNYGDTPASFTFKDTQALGPTFAIKPAQGVMPARSHMVVALRFCPRAARAYSARATIVFNGAALNATEIELRGAGHTPQLVFGAGAGTKAPGGAGGANTLFFRPTCVGATSPAVATLANRSRVPLAWRIQLPPKLEGVVSLSPGSGLLRGNESTQLQWTFTPTKQKTYEARATCLVLNPSGAAPLLLTQLTADVGGEGEEGVEEARLLGLDVGDKVTLHVKGEGTAAALAIDPPVLDLGPLKVGHPVKRTVTLVNQSDGVLRYSLECAAATAGADSIPPGEDAALLSVEEADGAPEFDADRVEFSVASVVSEALRPEELWVDEGTGVIAARASKVVTLTLFPRFRKRYALQLRCRTAAVAPGAAPRPPSGGLLGSGGGRAVLPPLAAPVAAAALSAGALGLSAASEAMAAPITSRVTAVCNVRATTTFPSIQFTDAFAEGLPKQVVWAMMGVTSLNLELVKNVTLLELELNKMEDKGTMTTVAACRALRPFALDFGCHAEGSAPVVVVVEAANTTPLPLSWELHSYDDPELEMENWVEPGRPRNDEEKARDFIKEHKIFRITPRHGSLAPGERSLITLVYTPSHVGFHDFPLFLHVEDGKRLRLQLQGRTVAPPVERLALTPASRVLTFDPTPIGDREPPLQLYMLRNGGPGTVHFSLDTRQAAADAWGHEVFSLCSEPEGRIPVGGVAPLLWKFSPLEAKVYKVDVAVVLGDGGVEVITLLGRGYHPDSPDYPPPLPTEGERDWARWPAFSPAPSPALASTRLALPSEDTVSLGTTLPQGVVRRVVLLTNTSVYPILYEWDLGVMGQSREALGGGVLEVSPAGGRLGPGERVLARVVFSAGLVPALLEGEVRCNVRVDEDAVVAAVRAASAAAAEATAVAGAYLTETGSVVEEVIEQHPHRPSSVSHFIRGSRLKARLPVHLYMTAAIVARMERLGEQWTQTLGTLREKELGAGSPPELPAPQSIVVVVSGRVLTARQIKGGAYIPAGEVEDAMAVLRGRVWVPPTLRPFYHDPQLQAVAGEALAAAAAATADNGGAGYSVPAAAGGETSWEDGAGQGGAGGVGAAAGSADGGQDGSEPSHQAPAPDAVVPGGYVAMSGTEPGMDITFAAGIATGGDSGNAATGGMLEVVAEAPEEEGEGLEQPHTPVRTPDGGPGRGEVDMEMLLAAAAKAAASRAASHTGEMQLTSQDGSGLGAELGGATGGRGSEGGSGVDGPGAAAAGDALAAALAPVQAQELATWQPLPQLPAPAVAPPRQAGPAETAVAAAGALLHALLREVMDPDEDPEVLDALACLPKQEMPPFVTLQEGGVPDLALHGGAAAETGMGGSGDVDQDGNVSHPADQSHSQPEDDGPQPMARSSQLVWDARSGGGGVSGAAAAAATAAAGSGPADVDLDAVLKDPKFQEFAEFVLESALFGLLEESAAGEWVAPQQ